MDLNYTDLFNYTSGIKLPDPYQPFEFKKTIGWLNLLVFLIGIVGNVATIVVLCRKRWRGSSVAVFLIALAVSDIMILLNSPLVSYLSLVFDIHLRNSSDGWCKTNIFFAYSSVTTSAWLLVGVTMERMTNVICARKGQQSWTQNVWTARIMVISIWVFIYAINSHFLDLMGTHKLSADVMICSSLSMDYSKFLIKGLPWLDFTMIFAVPFVLIVIGNTITIFNLRKMPQASINTTSKTTAMSKTALTVTLVILCVVYIVTMAPLTFFYVYAVYNPVKTYEDFFNHDFAHNLLNLFSNTNAAVNFFLYVLSDVNVRTDVKVLLRRVLLCEQSNTADIGMEEPAQTQNEFRTNESALNI